MRVKTSELEGAALDWAVAKAVYPLSHQSGDRLRVVDVIEDDHWHIGTVWLGRRGNFTRTFEPSTDWSQGGPLVERYRVKLTPVDSHAKATTWHGLSDDGRRVFGRYGGSPLIAAMRAIVAAEIGEELDVPEELCNESSTA